MYRYRHLQHDLEGPASQGKVRLLLGARQTGKTELLRRVAEGPETVVFDLTSTKLRREFEEDPARFSRMVRGLPRTVSRIVVDEIQHVPALLDEVQELYGAKKTRFEFFLTGSSARRLRRGTANLLPGRAHPFALLPIVRWEEGHVGRIGADPRAGVRSPGEPPPFPVQTLERRLLCGALPGVIAEEAATAARTLEGYVDLYLEEEIRREALVRDVGAFSAFLRLAAAESGRVVNLSKLSRESGVPLMTLRSYYEVLVDTLVGAWLRPYSRAHRKRLLVSPRFYLFDLGVRNVAAHLPLDPGVLATQGGELLEQWVGLELLRRARYLGRGFELSFWRTIGGSEVDFIWESQAEDVPVEVKWTTRPTVHDARGVEAFLDAHPRRARRGLVVCRCERAEELTERVTAIPWSEL